MQTPFKPNNSKGKFLSQGQVAMVRSALRNILLNADLVQKSHEISSVEKGYLEEIKKDAHGITRILKQARPL